MIIKKFLGKTEEEAIALAKKELGSNVVVLNVKKNVKKKGLFGVFKAKLVEVTVALEEESETLERTRREAAAKQAEVAAKVKETEKREEDKKENPSENIEKRLDTLQSLIENQIRSEKTSSSEKSQTSRSLEEIPPRTTPPCVAPWWAPTVVVLSRQDVLV